MPSWPHDGEIDHDHDAMSHDDSRDNWMRVESILDAVLDAPPHAQQATLNSLTEGDADLRQRVQSLLAAHQSSGDFMRGPAQSNDQPEAMDALSAIAQGTRIGPWSVLQPLGRGGMGEVYLAQRADAQYQQQVAIKLLAPSAQDQIERFLRERQLLADLDHPGLARLVDGGVDDGGRPYMAMEYVEGDDLLTYCNTHALPVAERLQLFLQVCDVVAYAHQHLVIHRDIKPANILVGPGGTPKLLDFGIATLAQEVSDGTATQALVTPNYAAPEQLSGRGVTTATDVHGLGATLYTLLTGDSPWQLDTLSLPVAIDRVLNAEAELPSVRATAKRAPGIQADLLKGDLDAICAKAMRKDPAQRYQTVTGFANDIRRHLAHEPVAARAGSKRYAAGRYIRRHRWGVAVTAGVIALLLAGLTATTWLGTKAANERDMARRDADRLASMRTSVLQLFRAATDVDDRMDMTALEMLALSAEQAREQAKTDPVGTAPLLHMFGQIYYRMDDGVNAKPLLEEVVALESEGADPTVINEARYDLANLAFAKGEVERARELFERCHAYWEADAGRYQSELIWSATLESKLLRADGDTAGAVGALELASERAVAHWGRAHSETGIVFNNLAVAHFYNADLPGAIRVSEQAWSIWQAADKEQSPDALTALSNWGVFASRNGNPVEAERLTRMALDVREALYGESAALAYGNMTLAHLAAFNGQPDAAIAYAQTAAELSRRYNGNDSSETVRTECLTSSMQLNAGQLAEAEASARAVLNTVATPIDGDDVAKCRVTLARALAARGERADADAHLSTALNDLKAAGKRQVRNYISALEQAAEVDRALNRNAAPRLRLALEQANDNLTAGHPQILIIEAELAAAEQNATAASRAVQAAQALESKLGPDHPATQRAVAISQRLRQAGPPSASAQTDTPAP